MAKYRKKPIVVEAEQWFPGKKIEGVNGLNCELGKVKFKPYIDTLEGPLFVEPGDWIITGVKGEKYPCKPDIFEQTYELVDEARG